MKRIKGYLAFILAACFVLTNVMPAFAEINQEPVEEQVIQIQENTVEEAIEVEKDTISEEAADPEEAVDLEVIMMLNDAEEIQPDASNGAMLFYKIDNSVLYISSEDKGEGYDSFDSYDIPP